MGISYYTGISSQIPIITTLLNTSVPPPISVNIVSPAPSDTVIVPYVDLVVTSDNPALALSLNNNKLPVSVTPVVNGNETTWANIPLDAGINDFDIFAEGYLQKLTTTRVNYAAP